MLRFSVALAALAAVLFLATGAGERRPLVAPMSLLFWFVANAPFPCALPVHTNGGAENNVCPFTDAQDAGRLPPVCPAVCMQQSPPAGLEFCTRV